MPFSKLLMLFILQTMCPIFTIFWKVSGYGCTIWKMAGNPFSRCFRTQKLSEDHKNGTLYLENEWHEGLEECNGKKARHGLQPAYIQCNQVVRASSATPGKQQRSAGHSRANGSPVAGLIAALHSDSLMIDCSVGFEVAFLSDRGSIAAEVGAWGQ